MKFLYEYRTSDNVKHDGVVDAADRDAAFVLLKTRGIRPSRLVDAPGFFNKLFGRGKRWIAIALLTVALACALWGLVIRSVRGRGSVAQEALLESQTRRQVIGDAAVIEFGVRTGWANVFEHEGDRFLASFAVPGMPAGVRSTSEAKVMEALARSVAVEASDGIEAHQIKAMVEGMKKELREFLAAGGTVMEYGHELVKRQEAEIGYYTRAKREIDEMSKDGRPDSEILQVWQSRNDHLRRMGVRLVPMPE